MSFRFFPFPGGVFVVLVCGLALAILVAVLEFCWNSKKNAQSDRSLCAEMASELRFAMRCGSRQRPAAKARNSDAAVPCDRCSPRATRRRTRYCSTGHEETTYIPSIEIPRLNGGLGGDEYRSVLLNKHSATYLGKDHSHSHTHKHQPPPPRRRRGSSSIVLGQGGDHPESILWRFDCDLAGEPDVVISPPPPPPPPSAAVKTPLINGQYVHFVSESSAANVFKS
ncbi:Glutamate receptor, ionotropic kainate 5 [Melipona quadrifasciata]|uniref:Glutamate receptor, ionotropic kainate 5 n=1 Tax=Melipona quadrifasciata TaxID=166423 RepID=A0A0M8ZRI0_9HYME|nr:Glutamate receptor, ionotropic kainate 5 [Melipona quadrifasciata]